MINKQYLASRKLANALLDSDKNAAGIAKVIQSIIPQESVLDTLFPPISVSIDQVNTSPDNKYQKFIYYTYTANLGPAYSIGVSEPNLIQTSTNGIGIAYFYPIKLMWTKPEEEIRLFDFRILDEIQELIRTRIGDFKDKVFFYNGINELVRSRGIQNETPEKVQFIDAKYYKTIKNIQNNNVIMEPASVPNSFYDANGDYHVGAKELISDVKNKLVGLGVAPGTFIIPTNYWNKLSTWDFTALGVLVADILTKGFENVIGNIVFGIGVYRVNKYVEISSGYTGEVGGYINVNVLGPVFVKDINANMEQDETLIKESAMGYLVPASEMFGVNYVLEPTIVKVESNVITQQRPIITLYVEYYNAIGIGVSRGFIGFPCRAA